MQFGLRSRARTGRRRSRSGTAMAWRISRPTAAAIRRSQPVHDRARALRPASTRRGRSARRRRCTCRLRVALAAGLYQPRGFAGRHDRLRFHRRSRRYSPGAAAATLRFDWRVTAADAALLRGRPGARDRRRTRRRRVELRLRRVARHGRVCGRPHHARRLPAGARRIRRPTSRSSSARDSTTTRHSAPSATWRVGVAWHAPDRRARLGRRGTAFKAPTFSQLFASSAFEVGNPDLAPERSRKRRGGSRDASRRPPRARSAPRRSGNISVT